MKILEVQNLSVRFPVTGGVFARKIAEVRAVDGVSFDIERGETLGLVGESGCGKSTVGRAIVNILRAMSHGVEISGKIIYHHESGPVDLSALNRSQMRRYRSDLQMIFQDPYSSLNPRMTVGQIVEEPLKIHTKGGLAERRERVAWLLGKVGLSSEQSSRYPHEFSGGQRQRIGIARALATHPKIIIADEPVSALDVSIQAQVINLMQDLQEEFGLSYLFIAHDLSVVREAVVHGRSTVQNVSKYVLMGSSSNFGNMFSMAGAALFLPFLPMLPIQILLNNLLYDVSEIAIPFDRVDPEATAGPVKWDVKLIERLIELMHTARAAESQQALDELQSEADQIVTMTIRDVQSHAVEERALAAFTLALDQARLAIADRRSMLGNEHARA